MTNDGLDAPESSANAEQQRDDLSQAGQVGQDIH